MSKKSGIKHKQSNYMTIMFIPESSNKTKSLKISRQFLYVVALIAVTIVGYGLISRITVTNAKQQVNTIQDQLTETYEEKTLLETEKNNIEQTYENWQTEYEGQLKEIEELTIETEEKLKQLEDAKEEILNTIGSYPNAPIQVNASFEAKTAPTNSSVTVAVGGATELDIKLSQIYADLFYLNTALDSELAYFDALLGDIQKNASYFENYPSIWPVTGRITSEVGSRSNPFGGSSTEYHSGMDIAVPTGTPVKATGGGTVSFAGTMNGYGYIVIINHGYGLETYYGHNSQLLVNTGDKVERGQIIAKAGSTGRSTGPHVHYEIRENGVVKNPRDFFKE